MLRQGRSIEEKRDIKEEARGATNRWGSQTCSHSGSSAKAGGLARNRRESDAWLLWLPTWWLHTWRARISGGQAHVAIIAKSQDETSHSNYWNTIIRITIQNRYSNKLIR